MVFEVIFVLGTKFVLNAVKNFSVIRVGFSRERMAFYRCTSMTACLVKTAWQSQRSGPDTNDFSFFLLRLSSFLVNSCSCAFLSLKMFPIREKLSYGFFFILGILG